MFVSWSQVEDKTVLQTAQDTYAAVALAVEQLGEALAAEQLVQPAAEGEARQPTAAVAAAIEGSMQQLAAAIIAAAEVSSGTARSSSYCTTAIQQQTKGHI